MIGDNYLTFQKFTLLKKREQYVVVCSDCLSAFFELLWLCEQLQYNYEIRYHLQQCNKDSP